MRVDQLTFTRFIAAISIVIYHFGKGCNIFYNEYLSFIFSKANVGVSYFFVLSGFVMIVAYNSQERIGFLEYIRNRLARIYPLYIFSILLLLCIHLFNIFNTEDFLLNIFLIQAWIPQKALTLNFPGWSLSVEMFFYLLFPFLFNSIYKTGKLKNIALGIFLFWLFSQIIFQMIVKYHYIKIPFFGNQDLLYFPLLHLNEFLAGNLAGLFFVNRSAFKKKNYFLPILLSFVALLAMLKFRLRLNLHDGMLAIVFVPLILFIASSSDRVTKYFSGKLFVFLGEISFGVYILQVPVWTLISDYRFKLHLGINVNENITLVFFIRFLFLIALSSLTYLYFEKPIRKGVRSYFAKNF